MKRYRENGGRPEWADSVTPRRDAPPGARIAISTIAAACSFVVAQAVVSMTTFAGPVVGAATAAAFVAAGVFFLRRRKVGPGVGLVATVLVVPWMWWPAWVEMWANDRALDDLVAEFCSHPLDDALRRVDCGGNLAHESNGNQCELVLTTTVSGSLPGPDIAAMLHDLAVPYTEEPGVDEIVQDVGSDTADRAMALTTIAGYRHDYRCM